MTGRRFRRSWKAILLAFLVVWCVIAVLATTLHDLHDDDSAVASAGAPAALRVDLGRTVVLRGTVDGATRDRVLRTARAVWGDDRVIDEITISAAVRPAGHPWLANVSGLLQALSTSADGKELSSASLDLTDAGARLTGTAPSQAVRDAVDAKVAAAAGTGYAVDDQLAVAAVPATTETSTDTDSQATTTTDAEAAAKAKAAALAKKKAAAARKAAAKQAAARKKAAAKKLQQSLNRVLASGVVQFETGSDVLTPTGRATLDRLLEPLRANATARIEIAGYTDDQGETASNLDLSRRRAAAARAYLADHGIAAARLTARGFGEASPVASNATEEGRARNRRIELHVKEA